MMEKLAAPGVSSSKSVERAQDAARLRGLTARFEMLLEEAQGFARGGDYSGAQARARFAHDELVSTATTARVAESAIEELRGHLDLRLRRYDRLARDWRQETEARHTAYVSRERKTIGGSAVQAGDLDARPSGFGTKIRRLLTGAFGRWPAGTMKMRRAP